MAPMHQLRTAFFVGAIGILSLSSPAFAEPKEVVGDYSGKTMCEDGLKKASFKSADTGKTTYYNYNDISHSADALSWADTANGLSFDAREKRKLQLQHVMKLLRDLECDTTDPTAQSTGIVAGMKTGTKDGTSANSYVQPPR